MYLYNVQLPGHGLWQRVPAGRAAFQSGSHGCLILHGGNGFVLGVHGEFTDILEILWRFIRFNGDLMGFNGNLMDFIGVNGDLMGFNRGLNGALMAFLDFYRPTGLNTNSRLGFNRLTTSM